jgi:hypothetical protein
MASSSQLGDVIAPMMRVCSAATCAGVQHPQQMQPLRHVQAVPQDPFQQSVHTLYPCWHVPMPVHEIHRQ